MGLPYFEKEFSTRFPYSEMVLSANFRDFCNFHIFHDFRDLDIDYAFLKWNKVISNAGKPNFKVAEIVEIEQIGK